MNSHAFMCSSIDWPGRRPDHQSFVSWACRHALCLPGPCFSPLLNLMTGIVYCYIKLIVAGHVTGVCNPVALCVI